MWHFRARRAIDGYFRGRIGVAAEAELRRHLGTCSACRQRYERHLLAEAALPEGERRAEDRGWQGILAAARAAGEPVPQRPRRFVVPALALAGAAAVALYATPRLRQASEPVERGAPTPAGSPSARPALHVYRSLPGGASEPVGDHLRPDDGLLLAYSNPGSEARWLVAFAVDASCRVYWFYPAHETAGENPAAIAIRANENGVELGEEIRHPFERGRLALRALFLAGPIHVKEVEALVSGVCRAEGAPRSPCAPLTFPVIHQACRLLEVGP